jgi:hypothetical protein
LSGIILSLAWILVHQYTSLIICYAKSRMAGVLSSKLYLK